MQKCKFMNFCPKKWVVKIALVVRARNSAGARGQQYEFEENRIEGRKDNATEKYWAWNLVPLPGAEREKTLKKSHRKQCRDTQRMPEAVTGTSRRTKRAQFVSFLTKWSNFKKCIFFDSGHVQNFQKSSFFPGQKPRRELQHIKEPFRIRKWRYELPKMKI